jgi:hypothetical protein
MGIEYTLLIHSSMNIGDIGNNMCNHLDYDYFPHESVLPPIVPVYTVASSDTVVWITLLDSHSQQIYRDFGVDVCIALRIQVMDSFETNGSGGSLLIDTLSFFLDISTSDVLLLFNYDLVLFVRDSSAISINILMGFWTDKNKARLRSRFQFDEMTYEPL